MGYLYDKLKTALGGSKFSSSHQGILKDWTPNGVRAIFICRDFILIANHVKPPKLYNLDISEVAVDIQRNGSTGALHNLLAQRQLSCMEEIYVDGLFQQYRGALDLDGYIRKLLNEKSRLRYYGYIGDANANEVLEKYSKAKLDGNAVYSYAGDSTRTAQLQYQSVNNPTWYKNYNLRPQHYALDSDNGVLARWFRKCEVDIEKYITEQHKNTENMAKSQLVKALLDYDMDGYPVLKKFLLLRKYLNRNAGIWNDAIRNIVKDELNELFGDKAKWRIRYLTLPWMRTTGVSLDNSYIGLLQAYGHLGVVDPIQGNDNPGVSIEVMRQLCEENQGFLMLDSRLETICYQIIQKIKKKDKLSAATVIIAVMNAKLPDGSISAEYGQPGTGTIEGYWKLVLSLCGWDDESFIKEANKKGE